MSLLVEQPALKTQGVSNLDEPSFCESITDLVLVASASRSGSTFFMELMKRSNMFWLCQGEFNHLLHESKLTWPHRPSDRLNKEDYFSADPRALAKIGTGLKAELGELAPELTEKVWQDYKCRLDKRMSLQWPAEQFGQIVSVAAESALSECRSQDGWKPSEFRSPRRFFCRFLQVIRREFNIVSPFYYDIPPELIAEFFPGCLLPIKAPSGLAAEQTPFIIPSPWQGVTDENLRSRICMIDTPSNCYRLEFLRELFPNARLRIIHLVRNAAASINGLVDGWLHHGFHAFPVGELKIEGYSNASVHGKEWWKFDLPPNWERYKKKSLLEVAAFQWVSAQTSILEFVRKHPGIDSIQLRYEDLAWDQHRRGQMLSRLGTWLDGKSNLLNGLSYQRIPDVMATTAPKKDRWLTHPKRSRQILDYASTDSELVNVNQELGYQFFD